MLDILIINSPKFNIGRLMATQNASATLSAEEMAVALNRHYSGDWGSLDPEDEKANNHALKSGCRLFSQYYTKQNIKFWIITEADRSATTVLLPEDY